MKKFFHYLILILKFLEETVFKIDNSSLFDDYNSKEIIKLKNEYFNISNIKDKKILKKN